MATAKEQYEQEKSELLKCALPIGTTLASKSRSYKVVSVLGAGGFGITYKVSSDIKVGNVPMRTYFAVKEHFMKGCSRDADRAGVLCATTVKKDYEHSLSDFISEAHRLNKLGTQSPNIVKVNEVFTANGTAYYVMEFLDGGDLLHFVHKNGALGESKALSMIIPIAKAVGKLHKERLLHLDIKPDNIVLKRDADMGTVIPVLIDFGIAKHFDSKGNPTTLPSAKGATAGYAPQEQFSGISKFAPEMDVYALGATLYFLLTGKNPPSAFDIHSSSDLLVNIPQDVSEQTKRAICQAMKSSKVDRTPNVDAFIKSVAKLHTLPIGYVLHSNNMDYLILDIVGENSYSITYKAIPANSVNGSTSIKANEAQGTPTVARTQYLVHELFSKEWHRRNEDGSLTLNSDSTAALPFRPFSEEADKAIPQDFLNEYDTNGYVKAEKFRTNNTHYYTSQIVSLPSPIIRFAKHLTKQINGHKKAIAAAFAAIAICLATYYLWPIITTSETPQESTSMEDTIVEDTFINTSRSKDSIIKNNNEEGERKKDSVRHGSVPVREENIPKVKESADNRQPQKRNEDINTPQKVETDAQKYDKAVAKGDNATIKALASKGYAKAYSKAASIYLKEDNYSSADAYARRALRSNVGRTDAINVIEILDAYGYYDNGRKPKY